MGLCLFAEKKSIKALIFANLLLTQLCLSTAPLSARTLGTFCLPFLEDSLHNGNDLSIVDDMPALSGLLLALLVLSSVPLVGREFS